MVRKTFTLVAAMVGLSSFVGLNKPVQAKTAPITDYAYTYIFNASWASTNPNIPTLFFDVRGQKMAGKTSGTFNVGGMTWTTQGALTAETDYVDQDGQHVDITAFVAFSHIVRGAKADLILGTATFKSLKRADGSAVEGVEILDQKGNLLYTSGRDADGNLQLMPQINGTLCVSH